MNLEKIARQPVVALNPGDTLNSAIQQMWHMNIDHLPVVKDGRPIGMVSERDLLTHACGDSYAAHELTHKHLKHILGTTRVDDIMSSPVLSLAPDDPVDEAARWMLSEEIHAIPLIRRESIVGIVTHWDLLKCYIDERFSLVCGELAKKEVTDVMIAHVFSVRPDDLKPAVIRLMRDKQIRHVPVVDSGTVVGVISESDILLGCKKERSNGRLSVRELAAENHSRVDELMSDPVVLDLRSSLEDTARVMIDHNIGCVPITSDEELVGIVTNTDLVRTLFHYHV